MSFVTDMLHRTERLYEERVQPSGFAIARTFLDLSILCDADLGVEICRPGAFTFLLPLLEPGLGSSSGTSLTCCEASTVLIDELVLNHHHMPHKTPEVATDDTKMAAKKIMLDNADCLEALWGALEAQQQISLDEILKNYSAKYLDQLGVNGADLNYLPHLDASGFANFATGSDMCWLAIAMDDPIIGVPDSCCAAGNVFYARMAWIYQPVMANQYFTTCPPSREDVPVTCVSDSFAPDDDSFNHAVSVICGIPGCMEEIDRRGEALGLDSRFSLSPSCEAGCNCELWNPDVREGEDDGPSSHNSVHPSNVKQAYCDIHDEDYGRAVCRVSQGECSSLRRSNEKGSMVSYPVLPVPSEKAGTDSPGEDAAWRHCTLMANSCQPYWSADNLGGACAPFIKDGEMIFVPAGETLESLEKSVEAIVYEAALVSSACLRAHGEFVCRSTLRPCHGFSGPRVDGGGTATRPVKLCQEDCLANAAARDKFCGGVPIFNTPLEGDGSVRLCSAVVTPFTKCVRADEDETCAIQQDEWRLLRGQDLQSGMHVVHDMFPPRSPERSNLWDLACFNEYGSYFSVEAALKTIECPSPYLKNPHADLESALSNTGVRSKLCVQPCPSFVFDDEENHRMWHSYVLPGCMALALNFCALLAMMSNKREWNASIDLNTRFLVLGSLCHGLIGALPVVLYKTDLPCSCETEDCFDDGTVCFINKMSIAVLHVIMMGISLKMVRVYYQILKETRLDRSLKYELYCVAIAAVIFVVSLAVEDRSYENELHNFHLARSAFLCRVRFPSFRAEFVLVYLPVIAASALNVTLLVFVIREIVQHLLRVVNMQKRYKAVLNISLLCFCSLVVLLMWIASSLESEPLFVEFDSNFQEWFDRCYKFEFSRQIAYGGQLDSINVENCGSRPNQRPKLAGQILGYFGESAVPLLVACFFGRRILIDSYKKHTGIDGDTAPDSEKGRKPTGKLSIFRKKTTKNEGKKSAGIMPLEQNQPAGIMPLEQTNGAPLPGPIL
jgi:hypothetical protein